MEKVNIQKIKTGLQNYRFSYLNSYKEIGSEVEYTNLSISPSGLYYIVESDRQKTKYYKRLSDAINLFEKRVDMREAWIDLSDYMPQIFGATETYISINDLQFLEIADLNRIEY
jgi:hypothetical protein